MEQELTGIERELVIQYLRDDNVPLTVTLEEKPDMTETVFSEDKTEIPVKENRVSTSVIFPVAIPTDQVQVLNQGIILLKNAPRTVQPFLGKEVRVQFYFNRLGLYFTTIMKECSQGLAIVVPSRIKRMTDTVTKANYDFEGVISYKSANSEINIDCIPITGYKIFSEPKWSDVAPDCQKDAKIMLEQIVDQIKNGTISPVENTVHLITIAKFLTEKSFYIPPEAVEGRFNPFSMIYIDENRIVLAAKTGCETLEKDFLYNLNLSFSLSTNRLLKRHVVCQCTIENIFQAYDGRICYSLKYTDLKEEDKRYLYEKNR